MWAMSTSVWAMRGRLKRGGHRCTIHAQHTGLQGADNEIACKFVTQIQHMSAQRTAAERPVAHLFQVLALTEVHRDGDHLGRVCLSQPGNRDGGVEVTGVRQDDSGHAAESLLETLDERGGAAPAACDNKDGVVAGNGADSLGQTGAIERFCQDLRLAASGPDDHQLLHALDAAQEFQRRPLEHTERGLRFPPHRFPGAGRRRLRTA